MPGPGQANAAGGPGSSISLQPPQGSQASLSAASASAAAAAAGLPGDEMLSRLPGYASLIRACWQQKPHRRPTAAAVCKTLRALLEGEEMRELQQAW